MSQRHYERLKGFSLSRVDKLHQVHISTRNVLTVAAMRRFAEYKRAVILQQDKRRISHA